MNSRWCQTVGGVKQQAASNSKWYHTHSLPSFLKILTICNFAFDTSDLVDPLLAETWISGYVDLLRRFRLWTTATEILRLAAPYMMMSPETTSLSQQSTLIRFDISLITYHHRVLTCDSILRSLIIEFSSSGHHAAPAADA